MGGLSPEVDPAEVGLDPARLERIDRQFRKDVDDGRLPGWLITLSRHGKLAYVCAYAPRDADAGLPVGCDWWAGLPLLFQPGAEWNYSVATDVLGRVIEVAAGVGLDEFLSQRVFAPLGMTETGFWVEEADRDRLAALYSVGPGS